MRGLLIGLWTLLAAAIVCVLVVGWLLAHPVQTRIGNPPGDLNAEPVTFSSDAGATVHGWWCRSERSHGAVLLLPGIRANRLSMVDRARFLRLAVYSVLLNQLRWGFGVSSSQLCPVDHISNLESRGIHHQWRERQEHETRRYTNAC
jgi:hypothetical protein